MATAPRYQRRCGQLTILSITTLTQVMIQVETQIWKALNYSLTATDSIQYSGNYRSFYFCFK